VRTKIQRWGNSLAVRIPKSFSAEVGLQEGSAVDLRLVTEGVLIAPAPDQPYELDELLAAREKINEQLQEILDSQTDPWGIKVATVELTDGRYMLCADVLSEIGEGGLYAAGFGRLPASVFPSVAVLPMAEALALRPVVAVAL
jgi:antitoxin MazE